MASELLGNYAEDYKILGDLEIGKTKFSTLYEAESKKLNKKVFLKIINKKKLAKGNIKLLLRQIEIQRRTLSECKSQNIIDIYDFFETKKNFIYVLEYCETNLANYLKGNGALKLNPEMFLEVVKGISNALKVLNLKKVIHRDIKPENIFLAKIGKKFIPKLSGFDSATFSKDNHFEQTGTLLYMAPEMIKNEKYNEQCDLWSLGISLHEVFFGITPYGENASLNKINSLIYKDTFPVIISEIPNLNILFRRLLTIDPLKRMNFEEFFEYINSKDFMNENIIYINGKENLYSNVYIECMKEENQVNKEGEQKECTEQVGEMKTLEEVVTGNVFPDLMLFSDDFNKSKFNNIIYYDENVTKYKDSIYKYSDLFEQKTNGAFLLCTDQDSLNLVMNEIEVENKRHYLILFNFIVTGEHCKKFMDYLIKNDYIKYIKKGCIFNIQANVHSHFKKDYPDIIEGEYKSPEQVVDFIKNTSSEKIKPFPTVKLVTFEEYKRKYFQRHKKLAEDYGVFDENNFNSAFEKLKSFIHGSMNTKRDEETLTEAFGKFGQNIDIETLDRIIIKEYTKGKFDDDLNDWLLSLNKEYYDIISYFTARLMYGLNSYAKKENKYYWTTINLLYRGCKMNYSSLLPYERAKGKIILLPAFITTSEIYEIAYRCSGRRRSKENYCFSKKFSVIYNIKNNKGKENWISNGVDIVDISSSHLEKEILFQPFSFFILDDFKIDKKNYTVDIDMTAVGKYEILEEKIKNLPNGDGIFYNSDLNIITTMTITNNKEEGK